jgi:Rod binding domain-containing protein
MSGMMLGIPTNQSETAGHELTRPPTRLARAAHEFEGQLMKEFLRPLADDGRAADEDDGSGGSSGALGEFATEAMGQALSLRGGFGIADRIIRELASPGNLSPGGK